MSDKRKILTPFGYSWYCAECNELVPIWSYDKGNYAYKLFYKNKTTYFCSWTCMRKFESEHKTRQHSASSELKKYRERGYDD